MDGTPYLDLVSFAYYVTLAIITIFIWLILNQND